MSYLDRFQMLGPTAHDFVHNPAFGLPFFGHIANVPSTLLGLLSAFDPIQTPEGSPALDEAKDLGAIQAWDDHPDIPDWQKFVSSMALGIALPTPAISGLGSAQRMLDVADPALDIGIPLARNVAGGGSQKSDSFLKYWSKLDQPRQLPQ